MSRVALEAAVAPPCPRAGRRRACANGSHHSAVALTVALAFALAPAIGAATVYKWVDANGKVVYSDQPPPANTKSEVVRPVPPPANPAAAQELSEREQADRQREKKRKDEAKVADKARAESERRRDACLGALGQQKALQQKVDVLYRYNEKGERVPFTEESRREELEKLQQTIRENCPG